MCTDGESSNPGGRKRRLIIDICLDSGHKDYRQRSTLGSEFRYSCRAKFFQQYRLFIRCYIRSAVIVLGWVNDAATQPA
jgi:toxin YhaV